MSVFSKITEVIGAGRPAAFKPGMTLVELMVTAAVLAIGLGAVVGLHSATMSSAMNSSYLTVATFIAESQSEWLRSMDFNRVKFVSQDPVELGPNGEEDCDSSDSSKPPCFFTRTVTLEESAPTRRSYTISIKVQWLNKEIIYDSVVSDVGFS